MRDLQGAIHRLELGGGVRVVRLALAFLTFVALAVYYDTHFYQDFHSEEGMDTAQLAANISEGRGFTTLYVRPFSLYLLTRHGMETNAMMSQPHPDLANAPVYPLFLGGLMKILPFHFEIASTRSQKFTVYQPEILIMAVNQTLFLSAIILLFLLARKLFDEATAWISSAAFAGSEIYWKLSGDGISTMLLILVFVGLVWCLAALEEELRSENPSFSRLMRLCAGLGAVAGIGALTRYSFGWIIVPIVCFLLIFGGKLRGPLVVGVLGVFLAVMAPWSWRNYEICGNPFGLAAYAPCELTRVFPGDKLFRSSDPGGALQLLGFWDYGQKLLGNAHEILGEKLTTLGANWLFMFFLGGLLLPFKSAALSRLRYFLLLALPVFVSVEALGRTHLSTDGAGLSSENLLVVLAPVTFIFGASFLVTLAEPALAPGAPLRLAALAGLMLLTGVPFLAGLLATRAYPVAYPPYYPPAIRAISRWMKPDEAVMSDIPWALAWYGRSRGVGLSLDSKVEFERIRLETKNLRAVFLSAKMLGEGFRGLIAVREGWGRLAIMVMADRRGPKEFPFPSVMLGLLPDEVFLSDSPRWEDASADR